MNEQASAVLALAKAGDIQGAITLGEEVLSRESRDAGLTLFVGMLCCRDGDVRRGIAHMRRAVELAPDEPMTKIQLARALIAAGANAEAEAVAAPLASLGTPAGREMQRICGQALLRDSRAEEAHPLFLQLIEADSADFESWDGLGVAKLALDDPRGAIEALSTATRLRPTAVAYWVNLSRAQAAAGDYAAGVEAAQKAVDRAPGDVPARISLARSLVGLGRSDEALINLDAARVGASDNAEILTEIADVEFSCKAFDRAEASYRAALAIRPDVMDAWLGLGKLLERTNRTRELLETLQAADAAGLPGEASAMLRARALRGEGQMAEALAAVQGAPEDEEPAARAQLIGDIADRLGDSDTAFAAFSKANGLLAAAATGSEEKAAEFRDRFSRLFEIVTPEWYDSWKPSPPTRRRSPLFIFGFPRSGTTLIDTMLSGHADAVVLEEELVIDNVAKALGPVERLADLTADEVEQLRALYFEEVEKVAPGVGDRLIVDKNPLGLSSTPLLYRLFPDARFVFAERHPCDVVLSCFITSSRLNANVASFYDFTGTALLYDRVLSYWQRCREVLPFAVHTIRYERLIAQPEAELRQLAAFAGLSWDPQLLANESNASARTYIGSPSYAQVAEPLYTRANGRWLRYRSHMEAVIPILRPWAERLGYELE